MDKNSPKISVLMSCYNEEKYIGEAIESILDQTFKDFEIIIIDDCSTDSTRNIIRKYRGKDERIVFFKNDENRGIFWSLNKGLKEARGKYIVKMDADDWSYPNRIELQYKFMEENPDVVVSGGTMEVCDEKLNILNKRNYNLTDRSIRKKIFRYSPFCHPTTIYKTVVARKIGGYDIKLAAAGDYDFYFRLGNNGSFGNVSDVLLKYRTNPGSISLTRARLQEEITLEVRKKAVKKYGYKMTFCDKGYYILQWLSMYVMPQKIKFWLFNKIRS